MATSVNALDRLPSMLFKPLGAILSPFESAIGLERPLWRDYSRYQGQINFAIAAANGVLGMASRSTISWGYQDTWFPRNWEQAGAHDMFRTSYHVLYPGEDITRQADNWYRVHPERDVIPRVIDLELQHDQPYTRIADAVWGLSNIVLQRDGVRPIIYSRYLLVNDWLASWTTEMLNEHWWWLAQFLWDRTREHAGPPTMPARVDQSRVILHQTADKKGGFAGEVESASVDWDRWLLGDATSMYTFILNTWGDGQPPIPPGGSCDCKDEIANLQAQIDTNNTIIDTIMSEIEELDKDITRLRIDFDNHSHESGGSTFFREYIVTDPEKTLACKQVGVNGSGYPIIKDNFYEPRIRWDHGDVLVASLDSTRADGSTYWYVLQPGQNGKNMVPDTPTLYVSASDVALP